MKTNRMVRMLVAVLPQTACGTGMLLDPPMTQQAVADEDPLGGDQDTNTVVAGDTDKPGDDTTAPADPAPGDTNTGPVFTPACVPAGGSLGVDQTYKVVTDGFTGDEGTTQPKTDANNGQNGDNPRYRRHNVARAHGDYWYTSSYQLTDEPNPAVEQWVDYTPDFEQLGIGCYQIVAQYRATDSRATYPAQYRILGTAAGDVLIERVQTRNNALYIDEDLGLHHLCADSYVRIQDPGISSITFNVMRFIYRGPTCP